MYLHSTCEHMRGGLPPYHLFLLHMYKLLKLIIIQLHSYLSVFFRYFPKTYNCFPWFLFFSQRFVNIAVKFYVFLLVAIKKMMDMRKQLGTQKL